MITDDQLYQLAIFLGSVSMLLIVLYHFLEVNAEDDGKTPLSAERKADTVPAMHIATETPWSALCGQVSVESY
ncbi:unnamed protein product [Aureobasidium vineae]|uniref:Dolichyl-diphosphooligosaccharide--protein glycosyltransferase subunit 4 n=1 Tax=Aureobasidium vineae TaxID=2773715 RepID=A0A9N8JF40_9PEZI|nr:unnamed protein product [Aureobasidium vineae]